MKKDRRLAALKRVATKQDVLVCLISGFLFLVLLGAGASAVSFARTERTWIPLLISIAAIIAFSATILIWWLVHRNRNKDVLDYTLTRLLGSPVGQIVQRMEIPVIACDEKWMLYWHNDAMADLLRENEGKGSKVAQGSRIPFVPGSEYLNLGDRVFRYQAIPTTSEDKRYVFFVLTDCTDLLRVSREYHDERTSVGYIVIDSVEELTQYSNDRIRDALTEVDDKIKKWVSSMNGILLSYDSDRYLVLFDTLRLEECVKNRFDILDHIRLTRVGDGVSVTVSVGISNMSGSLADREHGAQAALDLALQRGGDQVVYKNDAGVEFFGGKTKAVFKRINVKARTLSSQIVSQICRSDDVLIMGHSNGDFDSFASCVGMAQMAYVNGADYRIVVDRSDKNLAPCFALANAVPHLRDRFISGKDALERLHPGTLLIVVDVNNFNFTECPELAKRAQSIVVIDHHIKKEELPDTVKISYIEPTASSASELITELLEYGINMVHLAPEEADLLLSGILLDTKQFSRNTGTRTFAVAQFLRGQGASTASANEMFRTDADELVKESRLLSQVDVYDDDIAIATCDTDTDGSFRVLASKVADKMLTIKNVEASFALVKIKNTVCISGRSNGHINVQLILEELHGGGHFDAAGAQVENAEIDDVVNLLKQSIDRYKKNNK